MIANHKKISVWSVQYLPLILIITGIVLRAAEFISVKSLWADEAVLALRMKACTVGSMVFPVGASTSNLYGAPAGFLLMENFFIKIFGPSEIALRLFPFLCGLLSIFVFYRVARSLLGERGGLIALCFFTFSRDLIYFSSELKPYSCDVLVTLMLCWFFIHIYSNEVPRNKIFLYALGGSVAVYFAFPAVFVLMGTGLGLIIYFALRRNWQSFGRLSIIYFIWVLNFFVYYFLSLRHFTGNAELANYWDMAFAPASEGLFYFVKWIIAVFALFFEKSFQYPAALAGTTLILGCLSFLSKDKGRLIILSGPIAMTFLASVFRMYPFADRVILFLLPLFILLISEGIEYISRGKEKRTVTVIQSTVLVFLLFFPVIYSARQFIEPMGHEEIKHIMNYVSNHRQKGDKIYIYYSSKYAFQYYGKQYGFRGGDIIIGNSSRDDPSQYVREITALRGNARVWFLFTHVFVTEDINERKFFLHILDGLGKRMDAFVIKILPQSSPFFVESDVSAAVYLYDLSKKNNH